MSSSGDVSSKPLNINMVLYPKTQNYTQVTTPVLSALPILEGLPSESGLQAKFAALMPYLTNPLGPYFDSIWDGIRGTQEQSAAGAVTAAAASAGQSINSVTATLPPTGTVLAAIVDFGLPPPVVPPKPEEFNLQYQLTGCSVRFESGSLTAYYRLNFDLALSILTPVPQLPFDLSPQVTAFISNANLVPDSEFALIEAALDNFLTDVGNFLTGGHYESDWNFAVAATDASADGPQRLTGVGEFLTLLTTLNGTGKYLVPHGFTQCWFSVENGNTLTLTINHPLDPGPPVRASTSPGVLAPTPNLAVVGDDQVHAGATISVHGTNFPVAATTQVTLSWPNTSSGIAVGAQLKYQVAGEESSLETVNVQVPGNFAGEYNHAVHALAPNTTYQFWARCEDELTWSEWTHEPAVVTTAASQTVSLVITPPTDVVLVIGQADLSATSTNWNCMGNMPGNVSDGTYKLVAELLGAPIAMTTIMVGTLLTMRLVLVNPNTKAVITDPILEGGSAFSVMGEDFPDGPVTITVNGAVQANLNAPSGSFIQGLTVPGDVNSNAQLITVVARSGGLAASLSFATVTAPK